MAFSVTVSGSQPFAYQWEASTDGGTAFNPVAGATNSTYTIASVHPSSDNQKKLRVVVTNPINSATSAVATLTRHSGYRLAVRGECPHFGTSFRDPVVDEAVDATTATAAENYSLAGVTFTNLTMVAPNLAPLRASSPAAGSLTLRSIVDQADARNVLAPDPTTLAIDPDGAWGCREVRWHSRHHHRRSDVGPDIPSLARFGREPRGHRDAVQPRR